MKFLTNYRTNNLLLLFFILVFLFVLPFFPVNIYSILNEFFFLLIFLLAAVSVGSFFKKLLTLSVISASLELISSIMGLDILEIVSKALTIVFFLLITALMIYNIAKRESVDGLTILESINGYLLLGMAFTIIVSLMYIINPVSYNLGTETDKILLIDMIYYAFVTMSTLGYGDMLPVANYAKSTAVMISVSGQIYIAVIIAMLVGKLSNKKSSD